MDAIRALFKKIMRRDKDKSSQTNAPTRPAPTRPFPKPSPPRFSSTPQFRLGTRYPTNFLPPDGKLPVANATPIIPVRSIGEEFDRMAPDAKIAWLLQASPTLKEGEFLPVSKIEAGTRRMNDKEALCFALELALERNRGRVPEICRRLLNAYPADEVVFPIFGVGFGRDRLLDWSRVGALKPLHSESSQETLSVRAAMQRSDMQNVHNPSVKIAIAEQLLRIRNRIVKAESLSEEQAEKEIRKFLQSQASPQLTLSALDRIVERKDLVENFDESTKSCVTILWNYICQAPGEIRELLKASLAGKLAEIEREKPCTLGMIERLIDVPTAIDFSLTAAMSAQDVRDELQRLAAKINETFESDAAEYIDLVRSEIGQPHVAVDPEEVLTTMKRDRFLQVARVEFVLLRGADPELIHQEARRVFPEQAIL